MFSQRSWRALRLNVCDGSSLTLSDAATALRYARPLAQACAGSHVDVAGARVRIPGPLAIRLSVVAGNIRIHGLIDQAVRPGASVVDVGANIGYNTVYASRRVGPAGRVLAIEPAADNLAVLRENIAANRLGNVVVRPIAAGRGRQVRDFFLRGETSAVNSFFPESVYAAVTSVEPVQVEPLDEIVDVDPDLVKIDVEGAELDVLGGMARILGASALRLIVEWHPGLQVAAGYAPDALPRFLLDRGLTVHAAWHTRIARLTVDDIDDVMATLQRAGRPVELVACR
jgi:FkbM family methyltransferase